MKSRMWLLEALMRDLALQCLVPAVEVDRDFAVASARVDKEGVSFLTLVLPTLDEALLEGLREEKWPDAPLPFERGEGVLPLFLGGFLRQIFDASGKILDNPSVGAVAAVRQICCLFKKVRIECSEERTAQAFETFIQVDEAISEMPSRHDVLGAPDINGPKGPTLGALIHVFRLLYWEALTDLDRKVYDGEPLNAKHGPGATAERVKYNDKFRSVGWTKRLSEVFHSDYYSLAFESVTEGPTVDLDSPFSEVPPEQELPVRVISVPKTQKGPRIIAIEPVVMQFMQQGVLDGLVTGVSRRKVGRSLNFNDQSLNANRALEASGSGKYATLDLKEASDRVSLWIVRECFAECAPHVWRALDATRSRHATVVVPSTTPRLAKGRSGLSNGDNCVRDARGSSAARWGCEALAAFELGHEVTPFPLFCGFGRPQLSARVRSDLRLPGDIPGPVSLSDGRTWRRLDGSVDIQHVPDVGLVFCCRESRSPNGGRPQPRRGSQTIRLRKFASMGSAVCFPVEAMVFLAIVVYGVAASRNLPLTKRVVGSLLDETLVFGDDIIIPVDEAQTVVRWLEAFGLRVNTSKSFWTGRFRESCGTDAFAGEVVTPVYLRSAEWGDAAHESKDWIASWVDFSNQLYFAGHWETARLVRQKLTDEVGFIPMVNKTSPAVGFHNVRGSYDIGAWDKAQHAWRVKAFVRRSVTVDSVIDGAAAMRKLLAVPPVASRKTGLDTLSSDPGHLCRATRSSVVSTKRKWTSPY